MTWQSEVGSGTDRATSNRDFATKLVALLTSQHVDTVDRNSGGTGYAVGEVLTLDDPNGAFLHARFEVTAETGGVIDAGGLRILSNGAYRNRVATVGIGAAAGTGYADNDIVEVLGGTSREKCKVEVLTAPAGIPATVALFETGGAYSVAPGASDNATRGIGPAGFGGDDVLQIDVTMTGVPGTTALSTTGGGNGNATVDVTYAETGWTVDDDGSNSANLNNFTAGTATDDLDKDVRLVGDAGARTNKPYVFIMTGQEESGVDDRYFVLLNMSTSHNPSLTIENQTGRSPGISAGPVFNTSGSYILFAQNVANDSDFWIQASDLHFLIVTNENPTATTDNGRYGSAYAGFHDALGTETENPYPALVSASCRLPDADPALSNLDITGLAEQRAQSTNAGPAWIYRTETSDWITLKNDDAAGAPAIEENCVMPFGEVRDFSSGGDAEYIVIWSNFRVSTTSIKRDRTSSTILFQLVPGTTPEYYLWPLTIVSYNSASNPNGISDFVRGNIRGAFWIYNTDAAGAAITNFSEDFITIGTDRYRIFHNHVHTDRYQFIAVLEDV
jgi:hypothetical protein